MAVLATLPASGASTALGATFANAVLDEELVADIATRERCMILTGLASSAGSGATLMCWKRTSGLGFVFFVVAQAIVMLRS